MSPDPRRWGAAQSDAAIARRALAQLDLPADLAQALVAQAAERGVPLGQHVTDLLSRDAQDAAQVASRAGD
jgi:hypothetical protein